MNQTVTTPTLVPGEGMIQRPANPPAVAQGSADEPVFALMNKNWIALQGFVAGALAVPIKEETFADRYGAFKDKQDVLACIKAFQGLRGLAKDFGDPRTFEQAQLRGDFDAGTKPDFLYGEIIWVANAIARAAHHFKSTYQSLPKIFARIHSPATRRDAVKDLLIGNKGLHPQAEAMAARVNDLRTQTLAPFRKKFDALHDDVDTYASKQSQIYKDAKADSDAAGAELEALNDQLAAERSKQEDWTWAAGGGAAGIMVYSGGLFWPVALGWGLLAGFWPADDARKAAEATQKLIDEQTAATRKRLNLVADLGSLNGYVPQISQTLDDLDSAFEAIGKIWSDQQTALNQIVSNTPLHTQGQVIGLEDATKWTAQQRLSEAADAWGLIAEAVEQFTASAYTRTYDLPPAKS